MKWASSMKIESFQKILENSALEAMLSPSIPKAQGLGEMGSEVGALHKTHQMAMTQRKVS